MAGGQRLERLREEFKREAADIIRRMKDPRLGFVTVTDAEISNDVRHVKIFVSILGDPAERERTLSGLERAAGHVRTELGRRIRLRHTPEIVFRFDPSAERGLRINQLLDAVRSDRPAESAPGGDSARDGSRA